MPVCLTVMMALGKKSRENQTYRDLSSTDPEYFQQVFQQSIKSLSRYSIRKTTDICIVGQRMITTVIRIHPLGNMNVQISWQYIHLLFKEIKHSFL